MAEIGNASLMVSTQVFPPFFPSLGAQISSDDVFEAVVGDFKGNENALRRRGASSVKVVVVVVVVMVVVVARHNIATWEEG